MKRILKYFIILFVFLFILLVFFPKKNIYYYLVDNLEKERITISHKNIESNIFGLSLTDVIVRYSGIKMAISNNISISSYIFRSFVVINNTRLDSILSKFIPINIYNIEITHSLYEYNKLYITSRFDGGSLIGYIDLLNEKVFLKMKLSKEFEEKYKLIMINLIRDKTGQYFIYKYNPNTIFRKVSNKVSILKKEKIVIKKEKVILNKESVVKKNIFNIDNDIILKAIYTDGKDGFIVVSQKGLSSTSILNTNDNFNSYKLKNIFNTYAIFIREKIEYKIYLTNDKTKFKTIDKNIINSDANADKIINKEILIDYSKETESNFDDSKEIIKVNKVLINSYKNDFSKIWKEINIKTIKKSGKINGFIIDNISMQGIFKKLGLKKGDIIKSVNGSNLTSYLDAFKIYNNIDRLKIINIGIQRDSKNMELKYEIK